MSARIIKKVRNPSTGRWADLYQGQWRIGWDEHVYVLDEQPSATDVDRFLRGELEHCLDCMRLHPYSDPEMGCDSLLPAMTLQEFDERLKRT